MIDYLSNSWASCFIFKVKLSCHAMQPNDINNLTQLGGENKAITCIIIQQIHTTHSQKRYTDERDNHCTIYYVSHTQHFWIVSFIHRHYFCIGVHCYSTSITHTTHDNIMYSKQVEFNVPQDTSIDHSEDEFKHVSSSKQTRKKHTK